MRTLLILFVLLGLPPLFLSSEENFILFDDSANQAVRQFGSDLDDRASPCCSFNIALSLMGFDAKVLKDLNSPIWDFEEGYADYLAIWKASHSPRSWMKNSCFWYSQLIASELGMEKMQAYLAAFEYGNQDMSGGQVACRGLGEALLWKFRLKSKWLSFIKC